MTRDYRVADINQRLSIVSNRADELRWLMQDLYLERCGRQGKNVDELFVTVGHLAETLGRTDDERLQLEAEFRKIDLGGGQDIWMEAAESWLRVISQERPDAERPDAVLHRTEYDEDEKAANLTSAKEDLVQWFTEEGIPTEGIEVIDVIPEVLGRLRNMGTDAIARSHAAGVSAWISAGDNSGDIVELLPDGARKRWTQDELRADHKRANDER